MTLLSETHYNWEEKVQRSIYMWQSKVIIIKGKARNIELHIPKSFLEFANRRERIGVMMGLEWGKISPCCS